MALRLRELEPQFVRRELRRELGRFCIGDPLTWHERGCPSEEREHEQEYHIYVQRVEDADGLWFLCPKCFQDNGGTKGTHGVLCWRPRVPAGVLPGPGRWEFHGVNYNDLSLVAGSSSVQLSGPCHAHFHVRNGEITFC